jgi:L-seryl-tRNA(Ser) seleniumtransferase
MKYSDIPSISDLIRSKPLQDIEHSFAVRIARDCVSFARIEISSNREPIKDWDVALLRRKKQLLEGKYRRVINATGIVIHTNLGRAPLPQEVVDYVSTISRGFSNLELQLIDGKRGGRLSGIQTLLQELTGAEAAVAVNNNAAATMLSVSALATNKEVIVSRGELVEIGGSFRIPDVVSIGGAKLVEVGTTNRTSIMDFENAITENTGAFLRVHPSNYRVVGFSQRTPRKELAALANSKGVPLIEDLGSGLLGKTPLVPWAQELEDEESISKALKEGVDVVTFSGDKLLGGPQSGIIVGQKKFVDLCRKHPLYRSLRLDKMVLAALEKTLQIYREGREHSLPIWKMLEKTPDECLDIANKMASLIPGAIVEEDSSFSGGGALPTRALPTYTVVLRQKNVSLLAEKLRLDGTPIMVRVQKDSLRVDVRTLLDDEWKIVVDRINQLTYEQNSLK